MNQCMVLMTIGDQVPWGIGLLPVLWVELGYMMHLQPSRMIGGIMLACVTIPLFNSLSNGLPRSSVWVGVPTHRVPILIVRILCTINSIAFTRAELGIDPTADYLKLLSASLARFCDAGIHRLMEAFSRTKLPMLCRKNLTALKTNGPMLNNGTRTATIHLTPKKRGGDIEFPTTGFARFHSARFGPFSFERTPCAKAGFLLFRVIKGDSSCFTTGLAGGIAHNPIPCTTEFLSGVKILNHATPPKGILA